MPGSDVIGSCWNNNIALYRILKCWEPLSAARFRLLLVVHEVTLVFALPFLPQNFGKVVGTYEWYLVIL